MARELQVAETVEKVIEVLGGAGATARLTGRSVQAVSNWKSAKKIPPNLFLIISKALEGAGWQSSPEIWSMAQQPEGVE